MSARVFPRTIGSDVPSQAKWTAPLLEHWELVRSIQLMVQSGRADWEEIARWAVTSTKVEGGLEPGKVLYHVDGGDYSAEECARRLGAVCYSAVTDMRDKRGEPVKSAKFRVYLLGDRDKELQWVGRTIKAQGAPLPASARGNVAELTMLSYARDLMRRDAEREKQFLLMIAASVEQTKAMGGLYSELVKHVREAYQNANEQQVEILKAFVEVKLREMVVEQREADVEAQGIMDPQMSEWLRENMGPVIQELPSLIKSLPDLVKLFKGE